MSPSESSTASDPPADANLAVARSRVAALRAWLQTREGLPVALVETHISWVLIGATHAYKLKKPVHLPFVDFSTLAARRHFCAEELRLNQRLAPSLYLDVVEVRGGASGPVFGGDGPLLDVAVQMRRFPDGALWSERLAAGRLVPADVDRLAERLAGFHAGAPVASPDSGYGSALQQGAVLRRLFDGLDALQAPAAEPDARRAARTELRAWVETQLHALAPVFDARLRAGRVREVHGDLHLANLLQLDDGPTAFDGIEFDPALRWIDVANDIAFVVMDLIAREAPALAFRFVDGWLTSTGDHDALAVLRFYLVGRALVRAQVAAIAVAQRGDSASVRPVPDYLALALQLAHAGAPRLAITHGLPGSGKSFVSQQLLEAAQAVRVRSDVERKRLFGLGALESSGGRVPGGIYDGAATRRTYARLREIARAALAAGWPVIVDAAFLRADERADFHALAAELGVPFAIVDCRAPLPVLRERLERRNVEGADPSEADAQVLERLRVAAEPLDDAERALAITVDAGEPFSASAVARRWLGTSDG